MKAARPNPSNECEIFLCFTKGLLSLPTVWPKGKESQISAAGWSISGRSAAKWDPIMTVASVAGP